MKPNRITSLSLVERPLEQFESVVRQKLETLFAAGTISDLECSSLTAKVSFNRQSRDVACRLITVTTPTHESVQFLVDAKGRCGLYTGRPGSTELSEKRWGGSSFAIFVNRELPTTKPSDLRLPWDRRRLKWA